MLSYVELTLQIQPFSPFHEIAIAWLADIGFESFVEEAPVLRAYVQELNFNSLKLEKLLAQFPHDRVRVSHNIEVLPGQNWNALWESEFPPVIMDNLAIVAPFHSKEYRRGRFIEIEPKMSFGTGHHATTCLMCKAMDAVDFNNAKVLDMGTGTGILSIFAEMLGAVEVLSVDIEPWAVENAQENALRNNCQKITVVLGDVGIVPMKGFKVILANINKNVLLSHFAAYWKLLEPAGTLILSGFFDFDKDPILKCAEKFGFQLQNTYEKEHWTCLQLVKP